MFIRNIDGVRTKINVFPI